MISRLLQEPSKRYTDADPYEVSEYVNQHIGNHRLILNGDRESSATLHHRKAGGIDLCRLSYVDFTRLDRQLIMSKTEWRKRYEGNEISGRI